MEILNDLYELCNGIIYSHHVPKEAEQLAKNNGFIIIVGGSDDLMYAYGAESYLTDYIEHGYGLDGNNLEEISDSNLQNEASQLGLKIFWCGRISGSKEEIPNYDINEKGFFCYTVNSNIQSKEFIVYSDSDKKDIYCTGLIIKLPDDFESFKGRI